MRSISLTTGVIFALTSSLAFAQTAPSGNKPPAAPAAPAAKPAPAQAASAPAAAAHYTTGSTQIGTLLADPAAKAVLVKHAPTVANGDGIQQAAGMTLKDIQPYAADALSDKILADIDTDLAKLPVKK